MGIKMKCYKEAEVEGEGQAKTEGGTREKILTMAQGHSSRA